MVGVEQWAEIRRMHRVERLSIREIHRHTGLRRKTIRQALASEEPPVYHRGVPARSSIRLGVGVEPVRGDSRVPSKRLRELAAELWVCGRRDNLDDFVREVRHSLSASADL